MFLFGFRRFAEKAEFVLLFRNKLTLLAKNAKLKPFCVENGPKSLCDEVSYLASFRLSLKSNSIKTANLTLFVAINFSEDTHISITTIFK